MWHLGSAAAPEYTANFEQKCRIDPTEKNAKFYSWGAAAKISYVAAHDGNDGRPVAVAEDGYGVGPAIL